MVFYNVTGPPVHRYASEIFKIYVNKLFQLYFVFIIGCESYRFIYTFTKAICVICIRNHIRGLITINNKLRSTILPEKLVSTVNIMMSQ